MEINFISIEHINNKLCMVIYNNDLSKEIYIINNKNKDKLFYLLSDILFSSKKYFKK